MSRIPVNAHLRQQVAPRQEPCAPPRSEHRGHQVHQPGAGAGGRKQRDTSSGGGGRSGFVVVRCLARHLCIVAPRHQAGSRLDIQLLLSVLQWNGLERRGAFVCRSQGMRAGQVRRVRAQLLLLSVFWRQPFVSDSVEIINGQTTQTR